MVCCLLVRFKHFSRFFVMKTNCSANARNSNLNLELKDSFKRCGYWSIIAILLHLGSSPCPLFHIIRKQQMLWECQNIVLGFVYRKITMFMWNVESFVFCGQKRVKGNRRSSFVFSPIFEIHVVIWMRTIECVWTQSFCIIVYACTWHKMKTLPKRMPYMWRWKVNVKLDM